MTKPYTCPVCRGDGEVPIFEPKMFGGTYSTTTREQPVETKPCHPCKGKGVLWGPMDEAPHVVTPENIKTFVDPTPSTWPVRPSTTEPIGPRCATIGFDEHGEPVTISAWGGAPVITEEWLEGALADMRKKKAEGSGRRSGKMTAVAMNKAGLEAKAADAFRAATEATVPQTEAERLEVVTQARRSGMTSGEMEKKAADAFRKIRPEAVPITHPAAIEHAPLITQAGAVCPVRGEPEPVVVMDAKHHVCATCGHPMSRWGCTDDNCKGFRKAPDAEQDYPTGPPTTKLIETPMAERLEAAREGARATAERENKAAEDLYTPEEEPA